jgi:hypothetical protein
MKVRDFWDIVPCSLGVGRSFGGSYCLHHQGGEYAVRERCASYIGISWTKCDLGRPMGKGATIR